MDCLFCKIAKGGIPSYKIYEDEKILVFLDIQPNSNGHSLIIPKKHFTCLDDIDQEELNYITSKAKKIKKLLEEKLNCEGVALTQNNGLGQEIKHFHLHLVPRYTNNKIDDVETIYNKIRN